MIVSVKGLLPRFLLFLCFTGYPVVSDELCFEALGMENGMIRDDQISSSKSTGGHPETESRLNGEKAWKSDVENPWIGVTFDQLTDVAGVATQGREDGEKDEWVTMYNVEYTTTSDESMWIRITNSENSPNFTGNIDKDSIVTQPFSNTVTALKVRILPMATNNDKVALRFEVYGCNVSSTTPAVTTTLSTAKVTSISDVSEAATRKTSQGPSTTFYDLTDATPSSGANTGKIVGAVFGVIIVLTVIVIVIVFLMRRGHYKEDKKEQGVFMENVSYEGVAEPSGANPYKDGGQNGKVKQNESNTDDDLVYIYATSSTGSTLQNTENKDIYHDILPNSDQSEYSYAYADVKSEDQKQKQNGVGTEHAYVDVDPDTIQQKPKESSYTYIDTELSANTKVGIGTNENLSNKNTKNVEGWKENSLYGKDKGNQEGWKDNTVYAATDGDGKEEEGWEDNRVYATQNSK